MSDPCQTNEGIPRALLRRILLLWRVKLALTMFLPVWVFVPYVILQRWPIAPIHVYDQSSLDRLVEFDPAWVWVYVSVYLLVPIPMWLTASKNDLKLYAKGIVRNPVDCDHRFHLIATT